MMPTASDGRSAELRRLATASSVVGVVARHVADLAQVHTAELPDWLLRLGVPAGWQIARMADSGPRPARIAVCGRQSDGGWDGCETINVFGFTGAPTPDVFYDNADCTLRDLDAAGITTHLLQTPPGVVAVRSSGYFGAAGLWLWAQYNTYAAGSQMPGQGRILQQCLFVESSRQAALGTDIAELGDAVHAGFVTAATAR